MNDMTDAQIMDHISAQEARIQFDRFPNALAHKIGQALVATAQKLSAGVVVDVTRAGQCLFHQALDGTTPDNGEWVRRKNRVVTRFHRSSLFMGAKCREAGVTLEEKYLLPPNTYAAHGGAFPIILKGTGVIGTVTVSGLPQLDDHALVTEVLEGFV